MKLILLIKLNNTYGITMESNQISEKMAANESKGAFIEKIAFAIIPIIFSCIVYLLTAISSSNTRIAELENKIQIAVSSDNKMIINPAAELAREKLRQDFLAADTDAKIQHAENKAKIELLEWRIKELEKH